MTDKEFLNRIKIGIDTYIKDQIFEEDKIETLEEFLKWFYKQYGVVYGQS